MFAGLQGRQPRNVVRVRRVAGAAAPQRISCSQGCRGSSPAT